MRRPLVVVIVLATLAGCDSDTPTRPDSSGAPTGPAPAPQVSGITITGESRFTALNQVHRFTATAQILDGPARDVTAEATWSSSNPDVVKVSSRGEVTSVGVGLTTITATFEKSSSLDVAVAPVDGSRIAGLYRLDFTAESGCPALPDWARHREYDATIDEAGTPGRSGVGLELTVQLQPGYAPRFSGLIKGSSVSFSFPLDDPTPYDYHIEGDPVFSDEIDGARLFTVQGDARATKGASRDVRIAGRLGGFGGKIRAVNPATNATIAECNRVQFTLVRR
jgi:hypothetical protein